MGFRVLEGVGFRVEEAFGGFGFGAADVQGCVLVHTSERQ